jgi:two-component system, chemotaxis family, response regulator WspR
MNVRLMKTQELLEERSHALEQANAALVRANEELQRLASIDPLTGAGNRRRLDEVLDVEWRRAYRSRNVLALLMVDVDGFKSYNDTFGHQQGDAALKKVADALRAGASRAGEFVGRYGGEEFVVVIPSTSEDSPVECAELLRRRVADLAIAHPAAAAGVLTVSIGVGSCVPSEGASTDVLLEAADHALYRAKADGRNCVRR